MGGVNNMTMLIEIPQSIVDGMRLPGQEIPDRLRVELALSLYVSDILSFGKARELCKLGKYEFGRLLGQRSISRHYNKEDLQDDLNYARG